MVQRRLCGSRGQVGERENRASFQHTSTLHMPDKQCLPLLLGPCEMSCQDRLLGKLTLPSIDKLVCMTSTNVNRLVWSLKKSEIHDAYKLSSKALALVPILRALRLYDLG